MRVVRGRGFSTAWQRFFTSQAILPILAGSLALGVAGNAVFGLLSNWLGTDTYGMLVIIVVSVVVLGVSIFTFMYLARRVKEDSDFTKLKPVARRGLILLVSNEEACRTAIDWHMGALEYCWLLASQRSQPIAETLANEYKPQLKDIDIVPVYDLFDPLFFKDTVNNIYAHLPSGLSDQDVITDFTGMTAVASVGAVLACVSNNRPIQYVSAKLGEKGEIIGSQPPMEVVLTTKTEASEASKGPNTVAAPSTS